MTDVIFYLFVAIGAFCGFQRGAAKAGYDFTAIGMAVYFSLWLLPLSLILLDYVPAEYSQYAFLAIFLLSAIILLSLVRAGIDKMLENYPAFDSEVVISEFPLINGVFGVLLGACSGFCSGAFIFFFATFSPFEIPYVSNENFNGYADKKILCVSRTVNYFASPEWNSKQASYLDELTGKFRVYGKPPVPQEEKKAESADGAKEQQTVPNTADVSKQDVKQNAVNQTPQQTPQAEQPNAQDKGGKTAAQKFASKAVNAADASQKAAEQVMSSEKNAVLPDGVSKEELAGEGAKIVQNALEKKGKMKASEAAASAMEVLSSGELSENRPAAPAPAEPQAAAAQSGTLTAVNPSAVNPVQEKKSLPGVAAPWSLREGRHEIAGVTFTLLIPEVNEDGTNSIHTRGIKLGIRLPEDGKVPKLIDLYVPHPIIGHRDRVIYRKIRVDMSMVTYASVRNLKPELDTRYEVVETE